MSVCEKHCKRKRTQTIDGKKIFLKNTFDKALLSKIYRALLKFNNKKTKKKNLIKKLAKKLNPCLTKEDIQMDNKHIKRCSTSHVIREIQRQQ